MIQVSVWIEQVKDSCQLHPADAVCWQRYTESGGSQGYWSLHPQANTPINWRWKNREKILNNETRNILLEV